MLRELNAPTDYDKPECYEELTAVQKATLQDWIAENIEPRESINKGCTSYGLKHFFEASENGFYLKNGMFKGAMLAAGYHAGDTTLKNWHFNVSQKSVTRFYKLANE